MKRKIISRKYIKAEKERLKNMQLYEQEARSHGYNIIAGIDEAGRGSWAGPVVAALVILPENELINGINDSKKLTSHQRDELYDEIMGKALEVSVGVCEADIIDNINILKATYRAMYDTVNSVKLKPDIIFVDGYPVPDLGINQISIIKGDSKSITIAAASIIAKVTRDRKMRKLSVLYPEYKFEKNKGYGTKEHREALKKHGFCEIHRKTFRPIKELSEDRKGLFNHLNEFE